MSSDVRADATMYRSRLAPRTAPPMFEGVALSGSLAEAEFSEVRTPRPHPGPWPRVGFITPNLAVGGAEYWILGLLKYADRGMLAWSGVAMTNGCLGDKAMCQRAAARAPLYGGPLGGVPNGQAPDGVYVRRFRSAEEAVAQLCRNSDVMIVWGLESAGIWLGNAGFQGQTVVVAHGADRSTAALLARSKSAGQHLVGVSRAAAAAFCEPRVTVLHNGGDHERCQAIRARGDVRKEWGAAPSERLIGYVGRLSWEKNPLAAAEAVAALGAGYRAVYVGNGPCESEIRQCVLTISPDTIFVPPVDHVGDALLALDVFLLASPSEGFSLALTEAWLCGLPTVATRVGAVPELESLHGPMVVPVCVGARGVEIAAAVRRALAPENRPLVERVKRVAWQHYTAQIMADRWTAFLLDVAKLNDAPFRET